MLKSLLTKKTLTSNMPQAEWIARGNKMYLACSDRVIERKRKALKEHNDGLIAKHNTLPFWQRFLEADILRQTITSNWFSFNKWMTKRMNKCRTVDYKLDKVMIDEE